LCSHAVSIVPRDSCATPLHPYISQQLNTHARSRPYLILEVCITAIHALECCRVIMLPRYESTTELWNTSMGDRRLFRS
jgi:hypothetical protein